MQGFAPMNANFQNRSRKEGAAAHARNGDMETGLGASTLLAAFGGLGLAFGSALIGAAAVKRDLTPEESVFPVRKQRPIHGESRDYG